MMIILPDVLNPQTLAQVRGLLDRAQWRDGKETAGYVAAQVKSNEQLDVQEVHAQEAGRVILRALADHAQFISFALPLKILPPMFNRYRDGGTYGFHIDNAVRVNPQSGERLRTDISTTVFLNDPHEYDGGELIINDTYGVERVKLPAGHAVVYPGTSLHRVSPVTRGERLASFFWTQSIIADDTRRSLLFDLDTSIQRLAARPDNAEEVARLTGTYHNLIRQWAQM